MQEIYADYNGSAPICNEVKEYIINRLNKGPFANPNATHHVGTRVKVAMENARSVCAKLLGAQMSQLVFNSGSTEGISTVFQSVLLNNPKKKIIISGIEHSAVTNNALFYQENHGHEVYTLQTKPNGIVDVEDLINHIDEDTALVAVMAANNETGVIQPYLDVAKICQEKGVPFLCDTTQFVGKTEFNFAESGIDYAVVAGHKIGGMTGSGLVLAKDPATLKPLIIGGGQEKGLRGGTQNYLGNETLAVALTYAMNNLPKYEAINTKRQQFEENIKAKFPQIVIIGEDAPRLSSTSYLSMPGIHGQAVQMELESEGIYVTTSSACSDNNPQTSKVLKAMGVTDDIGRGVVRISLGLCNDPALYDRIESALINAYEKLSKIKSY
ncbi:aminotransferase, class V [Halobacteriovorax sp. BALOs_7]|uniref:cysteine desulfurase n=1 Tax=Halobacteriovorax vibrionivorans TaxID=2152716 RepID=A0ABY0IJM6_9BACT|nr:MULTISPECIES: cysteine desulfurase family protein [Halobacteriovorax]AYF45708.1 aminotransferase, class V [Halobacteriovorax sp. BALOs_7]RZF22770.1 cysteine desulfurase [Halobacteriovorax vibrionivorans]TGD46206.1 cysteine desulfurase [Halobacteriovorax sp. Y22]